VSHAVQLILPKLRCHLLLLELVGAEDDAARLGFVGGEAILGALETLKHLLHRDVLLMIDDAITNHPKKYCNEYSI
jgi:hypothetical protein